MRVRSRIDRAVALTAGREYVVYALGLGERGPAVYLADDAFVDGPRRYPLALFDVVDPAVSCHWHLATGCTDAEDTIMLVAPDWLSLPWFFNRVFDGEVTAVVAFARIKAAIDREALP